MAVKIFLGTIFALVFVTVSGLAYWFFPILDRFHQGMGGAPLKDPRGDAGATMDLYLSFLPSDNLIRAAIVVGVVAAYFFISTVATLIAMRLRTRRRDRRDAEASRLRTMSVYNARR